MRASDNTQRAGLIARLSLCLLAALLTPGCARPGAKAPPTHEAAAADLAGKTVALVVTDEEDATRAYCTGVWVSADTVITAAHCVQADPLMALFGLEEAVHIATKSDVFEADGASEKRYPAKHRATVLQRDEDHDLAILKVPNPPSHGIATLGQGPDAGAWVQSMGHSKGLWWSYSSGDVAAIRLAPLGQDTPMLWIQATTPTSPGNSGGGLFDAKGELVGICSRQLGGRAQNLNFFVHTDHLRALLEKGPKP